MDLDQHGLNIGQFRPMNNYVLVLPDKEENHLHDDAMFSIDTSFEPGMHAPRTGRVVAVPDKLFYDHDKFELESMPWDTDMELQVGDEVYYHYLSAWTAEDRHHERVIKYQGKTYYLIRYDRIFVAKRKDGFINNDDQYFAQAVGEALNRDIKNWGIQLYKILPINGFVLVEPVKDISLERFKHFMEIPKKNDRMFGVVRYMGGLNRGYRHLYKRFFGPDQDNIKIGDVVYMDVASDTPLEHSLHAKLVEGKIFYRVQRRYIIGKLKN